MKFCFMYSLNIPHSDHNSQWSQIIVIIFFYWRFSNNLFKIDVSAIHFWPSYENNFKIFFCAIFPLSRETNLCLVLIANAEYIVCLSFPDPQLKSNWISKVLIVMEKPRRNLCFDTVKHDWASIVWQWANSKHFLIALGNVWNSKVMFYNKTTCLLRHECFSRGLLLVTPVMEIWYYYISMFLFSIISPW